VRLAGLATTQAARKGRFVAPIELWIFARKLLKTCYIPAKFSIPRARNILAKKLR